ncbi:hypothetical protein Tco_1539631, partial [Tanacetum coccineum]
FVFRVPSFGNSSKVLFFEFPPLETDVGKQTMVPPVITMEMTKVADDGEKLRNISFDESGVNHHVDEAIVGNMAPITSNANEVNTDNVNLETPLESNKGDDVNSNANVEPTVSASLPALCRLQHY